MRKQTIINYEKEFIAWCKGEPVLVGYTESKEDASKGILTWEQVESFDDWRAIDTKYVLDNEYSEFSKALAEGKVVEGFFNNHWTPMTEIKTIDQGWVVNVSQYRIKPDEPKIKVGDWVIHPVDGAMFKVDQSHIDVPMPWTGFKLWQPQHGEWCWFWDEENKSTPLLAQFREYYPDSCIDNYVDNKGITWYYAEPFIGTLPTQLKGD